MTQSVFYRVVLQDRFSAVASKLKSNFGKLQKQISLVPTAMGVGFLDMQKHMQRFQQSSFRTGIALTAAISTPLTLISKNALHAYQRIQTLDVAFSTMLHSQAKGAKLMGDLKSFARESVFDFTDIADSAKALMGAQIPINMVKKDLRMLGDVAAGVGKPVSALAPEFAKVKMEGHLYLRDIYVMASQGIPIMLALRKHIHLVGQTGEMTQKQFMKVVSKGAVTFDMFQKTLATMTGKGGMFYRQMIAHSKTYLASQRKLKEGIFLFNAAVGEQIDKTLGLGKSMRALGFWFNDAALKVGPFAAKHRELIKWVVRFGAGLIALGPGILLVGKLARVLGFLFSPLKTIGMFVWSIFGPWGIAIAAISVAVYELYKHWDKVVKAMKEAWQWTTKIFHRSGAQKRHDMLWGDPKTGKGGIFKPFPTHHQPVTHNVWQTKAAAGRADIHITVDDKAGKVKNVQTYSKGDHHFNVGHNMVHQRGH